MTSQIPMKIVLPFLVVIVVIISLMQFAKPNVILLLQNNSGVGTGTAMRFQHPKNDTPNPVKHPDTNTDDSKQDLHSYSSSEQHVKADVMSSSEQHVKADVMSSSEQHVKADVMSSNRDCQAQNRVVFIKTHKTAGTTVASIFQRYGYSRNLMFALPWVTHIFDENKLFNRDMVMHFADMTTFDMITNHARFNRKEMEAVVPHAKFVTIIRDPISQFESAFGYFEMGDSLGIPEKPDPLAVFLENPRKYFEKSFHMKAQSWNGQVFDLGLNHSSYDYTTKVKQHIEKLDQELDLVMLAEYFDESLILLSKVMCWSYKDILYLPKGVRNHRYSVSAKIADKIREWNAADVQLYHHFNKTFWRKIDEYGPDFDFDLQAFRQLQRTMVKTCLNTEKGGTGDYRETNYAVKKDAPDICNDLLRTDIDFVRLIRWREVKSEFGIAKLLGIIAGVLILVIMVMTAILVLLSKAWYRFCHSGNTEPHNKCEYAKLNQNSVL